MEYDDDGINEHSTLLPQTMEMHLHGSSRKAGHPVDDGEIDFRDRMQDSCSVPDKRPCAPLLTSPI